MSSKKRSLALIRIGALIVPALIAVLACSAPGLAAQDMDYPTWLRQFNAWDQLERTYKDNAPASDVGQSALERAEALLNLNSPKEALQLIEMSPAYSDPALEARRLVLGGKAQRALGDPVKAVLWYAHAATMLTEDEIISLFRDDASLEPLWQDAFRALLWKARLNQTITREAEVETLADVARTGALLWPADYWDQALALLDSLVAGNSAKTDGSGPTENPQASLEPSASDARTVGRILAYSSLELWDNAYELLAGLSQTEFQHFWSSVIRYLQEGQPPASLDIYRQNNHPIPEAFWQGRLLEHAAIQPAEWYLGNPDSDTWKKFRDNLLALPPDKVLPAIDTELKSMLISEDTRRLLRSFKLAYALATNKELAARTAWNNSDKSNVPKSLLLSTSLFFKEGFNFFSTLNRTSNDQKMVLNTMLEAASTTKTGLPFWATIAPDTLTQQSGAHPFARLLLLANWGRQFEGTPSPALAKRIATLFEHTGPGAKALLLLADKAVAHKDLRLGAYYLNRVGADLLDTPDKGAWLDIKLRLEYATGRHADALKTFYELVELGTPIPVMTRLKMALLLQQNRDFPAAKEQLLAMWKEKDGLSTAMQAEIMFWLAEGEQGMGNSDNALDYYLRLAWQYPQENIWALTAMYRASIIYEQRAKYETAKKLLNTVVERADRKEQKEAAQARLAAIDSKMGKKEETESSLAYPF